jgi:hypothetical protein
MSIVQTTLVSHASGAITKNKLVEKKIEDITEHT